MEIRNDKGSSSKPCDTSDVTTNILDLIPTMRIFWFRLVKGPLSGLSDDRLLRPLFRDIVSMSNFFLPCPWRCSVSNMCSFDLPYSYLFRRYTFLLYNFKIFVKLLLWQTNIPHSVCKIVFPSYIEQLLHFFVVPVHANQIYLLNESSPSRIYILG